MHGQALSTQSDTPTEALSGAVERVTFHSEETGFCVLRVKVRGHRDLITVVGFPIVSEKIWNMCDIFSCTKLLADSH
jgi:exodeoxyribonuclease V alpha subunit